MKTLENITLRQLAQVVSPKKLKTIEKAIKHYKLNLALKIDLFIEPKLNNKRETILTHVDFYFLTAKVSYIVSKFDNTITEKLIIINDEINTILI